MLIRSDWRFSALLVVLLASTRAGQGQAQPASRPAGDAPASPASGAQSTSAETEAAPSEAEKIARLQRAIDDSSRQVQELTARLNAPDSEFRQAEAAFTELDGELEELRKRLEAAGDDPGRAALEQQRAELEPKHKLAKDRFDLAIQERRALQEQIATLQRKVRQDTDALRKLKGETIEPASQPAGEASPAAPAPREPAPASGAAATPEASVPPPAPASDTGPAAPAKTGGGAESAAPEPATPELLEARQEASRKEVEARSALEEVASITERMDALRKSIELEQRLFETSRQKAENARATERAVYETLQRKWEEGASPDALSALRAQIVEARERLGEAELETRGRADRLNEYQSELAALQAEHIAAMEQAERRRAEAQQAQKRVEDLESPLSPRNLWRWLLARGPRVGGIILAMAALLWFARFAEGRFVRLLVGRGGQGTAEDRENRARTLVSVFHSAATVAIYAGGGLTILTEVGVNILPLMGGAAVVGLAVAFGAQNLIRDYFYGFMILLEHQYTVNDVVRIGEVAGLVERITLRVTVLRGLDGTVHFVPNGEITRVSNMTHEWSRAVFDIPVAYKEDVDRVMHELLEQAKELRRDPEFRGLILEMPEMLGVDEFADSAVVIKFLVKTRPLKQWAVKRELLRRIKRRFDELGIEIPFSHRTLYLRSDDERLMSLLQSPTHAGSAP